VNSDAFRHGRLPLPDSSNSAQPGFADSETLLEFARVASRCSTPIAVTDPAGTIEWVNPAFELACGENASALSGRPLGWMQRVTRRLDGVPDLWSELALRNHWTGEVRLQHLDGSRLHTQLEIRGLRGCDAYGRAPLYVCTYSSGDATRSIVPAGSDPLTGLLDRPALIAAVNRMSAAGTALTLLTIDIAGFTALNEQIGWTECDRLLVAVGQRCSRLVESAMSPGLVGRVGADEFAVVFATGDAGARTVAEARIRALQCSLEATFQAGGACHALDFSFGHCDLPVDADDAQAALVHATAARLEGPVASDNVSRYAQYRWECNLLFELRRAVSGKQLQIAWQPQCNLASGQLIGAEALVRWVREDGTEVPPAEFIPVAENDGLIARIDDQVLELALRELAAWRADGLAIARIAVNMSAAQFQRPGLTERVGDALARHGIDAAMLDIEITESVLLCHVPTIVGALRELNELGVTLSIDDFGTGYSSLAYLRDLPIDRVKIDRSFVTDIVSHTTSREIVRSVVELAGRIGLHAVAEGIETDAQRTTLEALGCAEGQGFLLARPMPAADFARWAVSRMPARTTGPR